MSGQHRGPVRWWRRKRVVDPPVVDMDPYARTARTWPVQPTDLDIASARRCLSQFPLDLDPQDPALSVAQIVLIAHDQHQAARILDGALRTKTPAAVLRLVPKEPPAPPEGSVPKEPPAWPEGSVPKEPPAWPEGWCPDCGARFCLLCGGCDCPLRAWCVHG